MGGGGTKSSNPSAYGALLLVSNTIGFFHNYYARLPEGLACRP